MILNLLLLIYENLIFEFLICVLFIICVRFCDDNIYARRKFFETSCFFWSNVPNWKSLQKVASFYPLESYWKLLIMLRFYTGLNIWKCCLINVWKKHIFFGLGLYMHLLSVMRFMSRKRFLPLRLEQKVTCRMILMLKKLNLFRLAGLITLLLLMWR